MLLGDGSLVAPESFRGDGFVLRSYRPGDGPRLGAATRSSFAHLRGWMPWAVPDQSDQQAELLARQFRGRWLLAEDFVVAIVDPDDTELLGGCGYHLRHGPLEWGVAELGMWIRGDLAGQGLGTRALLGLLRWGFDAWPWRRLVWRCDAQNAASRRVAEKAGMALEGIATQDAPSVDETRWRDTATYAALRARWTPPPEELQ